MLGFLAAELDEQARQATAIEAMVSQLMGPREADPDRLPDVQLLDLHTQRLRDMAEVARILADGVTAGQETVASRIARDVKLGSLRSTFLGQADLGDDETKKGDAVFF
ncbi:MAG: hypothetical protein AAGF74_03310 [Pseudomonadota bacterium]